MNLAGSRRCLRIRAIAIVLLVGWAATPAPVLRAAPLDPLGFASLGTLSATSGELYVGATPGTAPTLSIGTDLFTGVYYSQGGSLPDIAVFTFADIALGSAVTLASNASMPVAFLSQSNIDIAASWDISGRSGFTVSTDGFNGGIFGGATYGTGPGTPPEGLAGAGFGGAGGSVTKFILFPLPGESPIIEGGPAYGDLGSALQAGSGGSAVKYSGGGGGAIEIGAVGAVRLTGTISSDGGHGVSLSGGFLRGSGASGGAILVHGATVEASALNARGGNGGAVGLVVSDSGGAGGGGGRVLIATDLYNVGAALPRVDVSGGTGSFRAASGSTGIYEYAPALTLVGPGKLLVLDQAGKSTVGPASLLIANVTVRSGGAALVAEEQWTNGEWVLEGGSSFTAMKGFVVNHPFTIGNGTVASFLGGLQSFNAIVLDGGTLASPGGTKTFASTIDGHGTITGPLTAAQGSQLTAVGGTLQVGDGNRDFGVNWDGSMRVRSSAIGKATLVLSSANEVALKRVSLEGPEARLVTLNGAVLNTDDSLAAERSATISGRVTNNGLIDGPTGAGEFLVFDDEVKGIGAFTGNVRFSDGYSPGASPALVQLGTVEFDDTNVLTMELAGAVRGSEYDAIDATGTVKLGGTLRVLLLDAGGVAFAPLAGQRFDLIRATAISGSFLAMVLPGLGNGLAWESGVLADGTGQTLRLSVVAVPEPAEWALLLGGLLLVGLVRRGVTRRR